MSASFPRGGVWVRARGLDYVRAGASFFLPHPRGFVVAEPPVGAFIDALPGHAYEVVVNGVLYYVVDGVYLLPTDGGYVVVDSPY